MAVMRSSRKPGRLGIRNATSRWFEWFTGVFDSLEAHAVLNGFLYQTGAGGAPAVDQRGFLNLVVAEPHLGEGQKEERRRFLH